MTRAVGPGPAFEVDISLIAARVGFSSDVASEAAKWNCDVDVTGAPPEPIWQTMYVRERRSGCGYVTFGRSYPFFAQHGVYDGSGALIGAYLADDIPLFGPGAAPTCIGAMWVAGEWPTPACASEQVSACRPASDCPRSASGQVEYSNGVDELAYAIGATNQIGPMAERLRCDVSAASLPAQPSWPSDFLAIRTEGCGAVTYELPFGPNLKRYVVYATATGQAIGASFTDDIPSTLETQDCQDWTRTQGTFPAPACASDVTMYCVSAY